MEESETVPLKNISNSIIVRESARKLIAKAEYDTRGISFAGAKIVQKSEHSSVISTEHNESVVSNRNENDDYSSASQTFKSHQMGVSIKGDSFNNGTNSANKDKYREHCAHVPLNKFEESKSLRAEDFPASSKFNIHVEKGPGDNVDNEPFADTSSIPVPSDSQCGVSNSSSDSVDNLASTDANLEVSESLEKDLPVGPENRGQECEESHLVETPHSLQYVPTSTSQQVLFAGTVSANKEKKREQCDHRTVDKVEESKSFRADLSVSSKFCDLVKNEHCDVKVSDKPVADSSSLVGIQSAISNNSPDSSENLASTNANVVVSQSSILKNLPISPVHDQICEESCIVDTPLTSTPHYINPVFKRCKKSISEKINEILVENDDKNSLEEITNHIPCEKADDICVDGNESKLESPVEKKALWSNANVRNFSSPSAREDVSSNFFSPPTKISRNFFSPPTKNVTNVISRNFFSPPTKVHVASKVDDLQIVYEKVGDNSSNLPEEDLEYQIHKLKERVSKEERKHSPVKSVIKTTQKLQPKDTKCKDGIKKYLGKTTKQKLISKENIPKEESKKSKESAMSVCFVSDDPCENDDNNNPEWLALKKLETDEARYKAVRKRWKNLTIPDPNKNLTYIQIKSCFKRPSAGENVEVRKISHKRAFSCEPSTSMEDLPPAKRSRTRSCTTSYDQKLQDHRRNMEEKERDLLADKERSLWEIKSRFNKARNHLFDSGLQFLNYHECEIRLSLLRSQQRQAMEEIYRKYLNAKMELENEGHKKSKIFNAALEEVKAFHNFYSNLDDKVDDCYFLTEPELDDVQDTNRLYQNFFSFYSC